MAARFNITPEPRLAALKPVFEERRDLIASHITPGNFAGLCPPSFLRIFRDALGAVEAHEGSIWIYDTAKECLTIAFNSGPNAEKIVGFEQPLDRGLISTVLRTEQPFIENEVYANQRHDSTLNEKLTQTTYAMIVAPLYFLNGCRGVISAVQLINARISNGAALPEGTLPGGFREQHLGFIRDVAAVGRELLDYHLTRAITGWSEI
jgi:hypothetical protein